jgi:hypothetical protein
MKFDSALIKNIIQNPEDYIGNFVRGIQQRSSDQVCLAQGYGLDLQIPIRSLAYAVPIMRLAHQLGARVDLYIAYEGVVRAKGEGDYWYPACTLNTVLTKYVTEFYPGVNANVLVDRKLTQRAQNLISYLMSYAWTVYQADPSIQNFVDKRGGESALRYMIEHLLYMRDPTPFLDEESLLVPGTSLKHKYVLMVGGPAEKVFYNFRKQILDLTGRHDKWSAFQLFTPVGDPPTYHRFQKEPVFFGGELPDTAAELLEFLRVQPDDFGKRKNVLRDWQILLQEFAGVEKFLLPHEVKPETLDEGYVKLKQFRARLSHIHPGM